MAGQTTLNNLKRGECATIDEIVSGANDAELLGALEEQGFIPGEAVEVVQRGPFGRTLAVRIGRCLIALRPNEARAVKVVRAC